MSSAWYKMLLCLFAVTWIFFLESTYGEVLLPPTTRPPTTPEPTEFVCEAAADVAFLVDSSGSIGRRNWVKMLQFLKDMVKAFNVGPDKTHIAIIAYSTRAVLEFKFDRLKGSQITEAGYSSLIDRIRFQRGFTFIDKALFLADQQVFQRSAGMRPKLPRIAILITDGKQTTDRGPYRQLAYASRGLKLKKVLIFSLGIGSNLDQKQLEGIASSKDKVFYATSFAELARVGQEIVQHSCTADPCESCSAPYNIGCRVVDDEAECICPTCNSTLRPVCASDDVQEPSDCILRRQACLTSTPISIKRWAACAPDCSKAADVAFIVDSSGSIGKTNWERTKRFLMRIVSKLDIGPATTHIAIISYSANPEIVLRFNSLSSSRLNVNEVVKVLYGLPWQRGFNYIYKALEQAAQEVFSTASGMRSNVPKIAFVITGGKQTKTGQNTSLARASKLLKDKGVQIVAIGVGELRTVVDYTELLDISSSSEDVFVAKSFEELQNPGNARLFRRRVCDEFVCEAAADVAFLVDSSGSIGRRNWGKMLQFLKDMVKAFNVGPDKSHIAIVAYSHRAVLEFNFNRLKGSQITEAGYNSLIDRIRFQRGFTFIDKALILADQQVFQRSAGMRPELPKIAILITDGKQTTDRGPYRQLADASRGLKLKKVRVYSLGIGSNLDQKQLEDIASSKSKVFYAASFAELARVGQEIVQHSCTADPCETEGCNAPYNIGCRVVDDEAECICPTCNSTLRPVCASDDVQEPSDCILRRQACLTSTPISIKRWAACAPDCSKAADVAFIVDSSGSIGKTNWERAKRFLMRIVSKLDIGPTTTHIAIISYSTNPEIVLRFNSLSGSKMNVNEVVKVLYGLPWKRGFTYIDKALEQAAQRVFTTAAGMRSNVPKIGFVITGGKQNKTGQNTSLARASKLLKEKGVQIVAIGVGELRTVVDYTELLDISSSDEDLFVAKSFEELQNPGNARLFRQGVCNGTIVEGMPLVTIS